MLKLGISLFLCLVFGLSAQAQYPKPPLEAYGALPTMADAELSPDGSKVAAIANVEAGARLLVINLSDGQVGNAAAIGDMKARGVEFYDNDHVILRVSETISTYGFRGDYEYSGAFAMNLNNNKFKQLLYRTKGLHPAQSGIGRIVGRGSRENEVLMPAYVGNGYSDPRLDLFRADLSSDKGRTFVKGTNDTRRWFVDGQGNVLARVRYSNKSNMFRVERRDGKTWTEIYEEQREIPFTLYGVMPDQSGLVFSQVDTRTVGFTQLMKLGFDGVVDGPIIPIKDREIENILTDNNQKVVGVRYAGVIPDYVFLDEALRASYAATSEALPSGTIYLDSWSDDRETVLYQVFDPALGDAWLIHKQSSGDFSIVAQRRPAIPNDAIATMMEINYKARDDLNIQAILSVPPDHQLGDSDPLPAIIIPHGGPAAYDRFDFDWMAQYFANRGYLVMQPNFRGSEGFGQAFEDAGRGEWGGKMQDDITDGVKALITAGYVDPDRICIAGVSYGGYAALAGAVFTPDLYRCVIAIAPVSDLNKMLRDGKREYGRHHWVLSYWENIMADGDARKEKLRAISPVRFADNVTAPVLLLHGDDDTVVPIEQSTAMHRALKRADKQVELVKLKGEDHSLSVAETRLQTLREMDRFIREHIPRE